MSQHCFSTTHAGQRVSVQLGWDWPIGHYFMVIEWEDQGSAAMPVPCPKNAGMDGRTDEDTLLYSNLDEPEPFGLSLACFRARLTELGIEVPESMFKQVEIDRRNRTGNRQVWHAADGTFCEC
jgi:hypothetical protein